MVTLARADCLTWGGRRLILWHPARSGRLLMVIRPERAAAADPLRRAFAAVHETFSAQAAGAD